MRRIVLFFGMTVLLLNCINAQSFLTSDDYLINGYAKKIAGLDYDYQSCIPGLHESLLLRATNGKDFIEWETEPAPTLSGKKYATFIWVASIGSSPGRTFNSIWVCLETAGILKHSLLIWKKTMAVNFL